ncbi:protein of unknown function (plasmid) [Pararobbsia alpina]
MVVSDKLHPRIRRSDSRAHLNISRSGFDRYTTSGRGFASTRAADRKDGVCTATAIASSEEENSVRAVEEVTTILATRRHR